jgi:hypothetical protein
VKASGQPFLTEFWSRKMDLENQEQVVDQAEVEETIEQEVEQVQSDEDTGSVEQVEETQEAEITVMIGDEAPEEEKPAPDWVRDLRKKNREDQKRIKELEAKLATQQPQAQTTLSKKPELDEFDYDTSRYETALSDWFEKKRKYEAVQEQNQKAQAEQTNAWQSKLENYAEARTQLKVKDYEDAESTVSESFNVTQQGVVIQGADNPALLVYALGKNPKKLKELASITDPVKFAFAIAKLETQLKVSNKKPAPPPEKVVGGTAPIRGAVDSTLERLRADAERTGDYSKVFAYRKQKRA